MVSAVKVGMFLKKNADRVRNGMKIISNYDSHSKQQRWRLAGWREFVAARDAARAEAATEAAATVVTLPTARRRGGRQQKTGGQAAGPLSRARQSRGAPALRAPHAHTPSFVRAPAEAGSRTAPRSLVSGRGRRRSPRPRGDSRADRTGQRKRGQALRAARGSNADGAGPRRRRPGNGPPEPKGTARGLRVLGGFLRYSPPEKKKEESGGRTRARARGDDPAKPPQSPQPPQPPTPSYHSSPASFPLVPTFRVRLRCVVVPLLRPALRYRSAPATLAMNHCARAFAGVFLAGFGAARAGLWARRGHERASSGQRRAPADTAVGGAAP